jgi:hypothetical protein
MNRPASSSRAAQGGSIILTALLIGMLLIAFVTQLAIWSRKNNDLGVHRMATLRALQNADSGISETMEMLRRPGWVLSLQPGAQQSFQRTVASDTRGRYEVTFTRDSDDFSLVHVVSTGAYQLTSGAFELGVSSRGQVAVISALLRVRSVGDFFAAVPSSLTIGDGADISQGSVYARDLMFAPGTASPNPARIREAYYFSSVFPSETPSTVIFTVGGTGKAVKLSHEPNLSAVDSTLRRHYKAWAGNDTLAAGAALDGTLGAAGDSANIHGILYCDGDVHVAGGPASSSSLLVQRDRILYSTGTVWIHGDVRTGGGWLAIIAEGDIVLASNAPTDLTLDATLITGRSFLAEQTALPRNRLTFSGGFHAQSGAQIGTSWPDRRYRYQRAPETMVLPFFLNLEAYNVLRGRYNQ